MTSPRYKLLVAVLEREGISADVSDVVADEIWDLCQNACHCREFPYTRRDSLATADEAPASVRQLFDAIDKVNAQLDVLLEVARSRPPSGVSQVDWDRYQEDVTDE